VPRQQKAMAIYIFLFKHIFFMLRRISQVKPHVMASLASTVNCTPLPLIFVLLPQLTQQLVLLPT
jgi:hypothetical protein